MRRLLLVLLAGLAGAAEPVSLDDARSTAQRRALDVALAAWDHAAAKGDASAAFGAALPDVVGFIDTSVGAGLTPGGFQRPTAGLLAIGGRATARLVDPSTWAAAAAARRTARGQEATLEWARVMARQQATERYLTAVVERQVADALLAAATDAQADADGVEELVAAGLRPPADAARTRAIAFDLRARAEEAKGLSVGACAALQDLMATAVDGVCAVQAPPLGEPAAASEDHPALIAAAEALAAARASRTAAIGAQLPTVEASGLVAHYETPNGGGVGWSAGLGVQIPTRVLAEGRGELARASAAESAAEEQLAGQRRALDAARVGAEARWSAATASLEARKEGVAAADSALQQVQQRYGAGLSDVSALLDARRAAVEARVGQLRAEGAAWQALAAVEAARGVR